MKVTIGREYKSTLKRGRDTLSTCKGLTVLGRGSMTNIQDKFVGLQRRWPVLLDDPYDRNNQCFLSWNMVKWYLQRFDMQ